MHDRTATPKPLVGALPQLKGYGRDPRIDACRGAAQLRLQRCRGVFMFVSGVTCALAYGNARWCEGWTGVIGRKKMLHTG